MMKFLLNIVGIAGFEFAVLLAIAEIVFLLSVQGIGLDTVVFASGNF